MNGPVSFSKAFIRSFLHAIFVWHHFNMKPPVTFTLTSHVPKDSWYSKRLSSFFSLKLNQHEHSICRNNKLTHNTLFRINPKQHRRNNILFYMIRNLTQSNGKKLRRECGVFHHIVVYGKQYEAYAYQTK